MSDALTITIVRDINGWHSEISRSEMGEIGTCSGPTLAGVMDLAWEIVSEHDPEWADFDANGSWYDLR